MHDTVIRGGTILDGTGQPGFTGDLAIENGRIAQVGGKAGPGRREIKADGLLVTPGWVDAHTHYDGQATWDSLLAPSSWHGVSTILFGNCGVGFAPVRKEHHESLIGLMEAVEEIPGIALAEGLKWDWESFPDYLDALERIPHAIDIGAQIPHHPLRVYVMGERAINLEPATGDDIAEMQRLTRQAMEAGAFGFTTSRTNSHKTLTGEMVPSRYSEVDELMGIGMALKGLGYGAFGMNSDFDDESNELDWMTRLAQETGRPVWFLLTDRMADPQRWRRLMKGVHAARAQGAMVTAQVAGRPVGVMMGVDTALNPFSIRPSYQELLKLPADDRLKRLQDPAMRAQILSEAPSPELVRVLSQFRQQITTRWDRMFVMGDPPDYEPSEASSVAAIARAGNHTPDEVAYDYLSAEPNRFLFFPIVGYTQDNLDIIRTMLTDSATVLGLSDGGAHCSSVVDAGVPSWMLIHWGRDRTRGPGLPLELLVKRQTSETADFFGFADRGRLAPGLRADVNVIDFNAMRLHIPEVYYDLPAGGRRLMQRVDGYVATFVNGTPVFEQGAYTGATPGRLVRAG
jgi:N-acyl-D-aspartate/D-glutamate deacylase